MSSSSETPLQLASMMRSAYQSHDDSPRSFQSASRDSHNESFYRRRVNHDVHHAGNAVEPRRRPSNFLGQSVATSSTMGIEIPHSLVHINGDVDIQQPKALPIGELDIRSRPSFMMTIFMLPFPFGKCNSNKYYY